jgi:hypothetical protein
MPRPWGPPSMSYPPCPPEVGLYRPWGLPIHFQPRWSGPTDGFGHGGYYAGDGRYGYVDHLQDRRTPRQDNQMVWNPKLEDPISLKTIAAPNQHNKWWVPKDEASANGSRGSQGQIGSRSEASTNNKAKSNAEKGPAEVAAEQNRVLEEKVETKIEVRASSQQPQN